MSLPFTWGTEPAERLLEFPCDRFVEPFHGAYYRGITILASPQRIFRWLCQLRAAPYSYDWIDNPRRRSPRTLTPGLEEIAIGQKVMFSFRVVDFEANRHLTIRMIPSTLASRIFGDIAASYLIVPLASDRCRLLVKVVARYPSGALGRFMRLVLPWGDMIMMRRQLLNFKMLSEQRPDRP